MRYITSVAELIRIHAENTFVVVYFNSQNCPPCKKLSPVYDTLSDQFPHIDFIKVDCGTPNELAVMHKISAVPTIILFKSGKVVHTHYGANEQELLSAIEKHFS